MGELVRYPIAEIFSSLQGEGTFTGSKMLFVRLAGCTVGKPWKKEELGQLPILPTPSHEKCVAWDGTAFICDTNYKKSMYLYPSQILEERKKDEPIVCVTGGEPMMHKLEPFIEACMVEGIKQVNFETSGTISFIALKLFCQDHGVIPWFTVSPKHNYKLACLDTADEIKVLVDRRTFSREKFQQEFGVYIDKVFFQPINQEETIDRDNLNFCIQLIDQFPEARLSTQMHKYWNVR